MAAKPKKTPALDLDSMSLKDLLALQMKITATLRAARDSERASLKQKMAELAGAHGFSVGELFGSKGPIARRGIARYANPDDKSDTWTGRGRKPNWLLVQLKKGANLEDFAI